MCDRGCEELFTSKYCKVKNVNLGQMMAKMIRTNNNACVMKEYREDCHIRKHDERWLWHKRFG
jgi:hypothetical protein